MFLTPDEVESLTGYKKRSAQTRWLKSEGFEFVVGGDGKVKLLRQAVVQRLGGLAEPIKREPQLRLPRRGN